MTERKPPGTGRESFIDRQIREAQERGVAGPEVTIVPFDVERVVGQWRERREER